MLLYILYNLLYNFSRYRNVPVKCFSLIHNLRSLAASNERSIAVHRHSLASGNICALYICRREKFADVIYDPIHFLSSFISRRTVISWAAARDFRREHYRFSQRASLRETKKSAGIVVIPLGEIRVTARGILQAGGNCTAAPSEVCTSRRPMFASRSSSYRPFSSLCPRLHLASLRFFLLIRWARCNFRNFRNESASPPWSSLSQIGIGRLRRNGGQFRKLAALI